MGRKRIYTDEDLLNKARDFYKQHGRVPTEPDFPSGLIVTIKRHIGKWPEYIRRALDMKARCIDPTDDELLLTLRKYYMEQKKFPTLKILKSFGWGEGLISRRFHTLNEALELAVGTSPRIEILASIATLTKPPCNEASSAEIQRELQSRGVIMDTYSQGYHLGELSYDNMILGGRYDRTRWFKLTQKGRELLAKFERRGKK